MIPMKVSNKMIILGDSVLKGVMYLDDGVRGKYKLYSGALEKRMAENGITLTRCCHMGATIENGLDRMKKMIAKGISLENTTVLFEFGGNDCAYDWRRVSEAPNERHSPKTELGRFIELYREAVELVRGAGADVMISTLVPIDASKYMSFISRGLSYDNILSWLGDVNMLYRWHESYNRAVEQLADSCGAELFDLRNEFLSTHEFGTLIGADGIHPTENGHRMIEDITVAALSAAV